MKQRLLSVIALMTVAFGVYAAVGDDITAKYLQNADFSADTPIQTGICTYDYDMEKNGTTLYGMQPVTAWTANFPTDNIVVEGRSDQNNAKAAGVFAINSETTIWLGGNGYPVPMTDSKGNDTGNVLGLVNVWSSKGQYTQAVTFPAGAYRIIFPTYLSIGGTKAISANTCGFLAEDGKTYYCDKLTWTPETWEEASVEFLLKKETSGFITIGYDAANSGSADMPHLFFERVIIQEGDAAALIKAEVDVAKVTLLEVIEAGEELGVNTSASQAVYDDPNATLEQVEAAIAKQRELNEAGLTDFTDFFINNAHFDKGTPLDGGVCTYEKDIATNAESGALYFGMQPIDYWTANMPNSDARASGLFAVGSPENVWLGTAGYTTPATKANGATTGNLFGFVSVWTAESYYYQHVTLPAGTYTITIPTFNTGGTGKIAKNLCGFIADDGTEYLATTMTFDKLNVWQEETIKFTLENETSGRICIGYTAENAGSSAMPHLWIDEFLLKYNGLIDIKPSLLALQATVRSAEPYVSFDYGQYEESLRAKVEEAYNAAVVLVEATSEDDDANTAAATTLNNLIIEAKDSRNAYTNLENFINGALAEAIEKYSEDENMSNLVDQLEEMEETYNDAYESGSYSKEQINEAINGLKDVIVNAVKEAFDAAVAAGGKQNVDISILFNNIDYANSTVTGWENETGTTAFLSRVQTAEVWNQSNFNVYQTLEDMPHGVYEISTNGFYRAAGNQNNYRYFEADDVPGQAYLYANLNQTLMNNVALYGVPSRDTNHTAGIQTAEGDSLYLPNSNDNAHWLFYDQQQAKNTVTTALVEDGTLTFGVKGVNLEGDEWTCWGAFTIIYKGEVGIEDVLDDQIETLIAQASDIYESDSYGGVEKAGTGLESAIDGGRNAQEADDINAKKEAITALQEAIEYAEKSPALMAKLLDLIEQYDVLVNESEIDGNSEALEELFDEIGDGDSAESNEQVEGWIASFPKVWSQFVCGQEGWNDATADEPLNITEVIINPDFETGNMTGWTVERSDGDSGAKSTENATYAMTNSSGSFLYNTWNGGTTGYYCNQDIYLPAGCYVLTCVVSTDPDKVVIAHAGEVKVETTCAGKEEGIEVSIAFQQEEEGFVNIGVEGVETWYKADNFCLYYVGDKDVNAVRGINADTAASQQSIYNLAGQKVQNTQKGIYIIDGKKVVVK